MERVKTRKPSVPSKNADLMSLKISRKAIQRKICLITRRRIGVVTGLTPAEVSIASNAEVRERFS